MLQGAQYYFVLAFLNCLTKLHTPSTNGIKSWMLTAIHSYYTDSTIKLSQEIYSWSVKGANCITLSPHVSIVKEHPTSSPIAFFDVALGTWEVPPRKPDGSRGSDMLCIDALNTWQIWSSVVARDMRNLGHGLLKLWSSSWSNAKFRVPLQPCREMRQDNIDIVQFASAVYYCSEDEGKATPLKNRAVEDRICSTSVWLHSINCHFLVGRLWIVPPYQITLVVRWALMLSAWERKTTFALFATRLSTFLH